VKTIVTLTMNPAIDMFLEVSRLVPDRRLPSAAPEYGPGGGGINVSRAISRLGGTSTALFPAGGHTGDLLVSLMQRESIPVNVVRVAAETRRNVNVRERATRNDFRIVLPGSELQREEWEHCLRALESIQPVPDFLVASGSLPPGTPVDFYARVAAIAARKGFRLIVDTAGDPLRHAATTGTYLLKPNLGELAAISGGALTETLIEGAARSVIATDRAKVVVVSAGSGGAILVDCNGVQRIAAPIVPIASRAGAGDSMVGGIVVALARGWTVEDAVAFGVAAGAAAVMTAGHELCRREDAEMLFEQMHARRAELVAH
jgi:6-phosphofructokinase 2